jgi:hypothetical protein
MRPGIEAIVAQQFDLGQEVLAKGLVPILEPEVTISIADKAGGRGHAAGVDPEAPRDAGSAGDAEAQSCPPRRTSTRR